MSNYIEYAKDLTFADYLVEGTHGRTGVYIKTRDNGIADEKLRQGWICEVINGGFWLRSPDISLIDITEPSRIDNLGDHISTYSAFKFLKDLKKRSGLGEFINGVVFNDQDHYGQFDYYISEGDVLEGEIRIGGSDTRIKQLREAILQRVLYTSDWHKCRRDAVEFLGDTRKIGITSRSLHDFDQESATFIKQLNAIKQSVYPRSEPTGMKTVDNLIEQLPDYDVMIFLPTGCFRYITSFLNKDTIDRIMLWEVHYDDERPETMKLMNKHIENKRCLIVDKTYTGKTLERTANLVSQEGGIPIRFGLFPKSRRAIKNAEYVLFLDRVIDGTRINLSDPNWLDNTFRDVVAAKEARPSLMY